MQRRYDIDALRVIAIFLLMLYHSAIVFQSWAREFVQFPQSDESLEGLWSLMLALNIWRIPLLFIVSGIGFALIIKKRNKRQLLSERSKRILLPAIFGTIFIVPIHYWLFYTGTNQSYAWSLNPGHLWFLFNIFLYVLIGIIPMYALRELKVKNTLLMVYSLPILLAIESFLIPYSEYSAFAFTLHGLTVGVICFTYGFALAKSESWEFLSRSGFIHLTLALALYLFRVLLWQNKPPTLLLSTEASLWLLSALGLSYRYLNKKSAWLTYLSPAVYPMYILHMMVMYTICKLILPVSLPAEVQFLIIVTCTISVSYIGYLLVKPIPYVRVLLGMR
ncbi:acyltransferase family protein [Agaribacterium sp. ZY112]|uniref:acyltransferase family protein n=1 Tax=Agaribacterium sp. ZY112 TaxID=3233574 RepID=UPI00352661DB